MVKTGNSFHLRLISKTASRTTFPKKLAAQRMSSSRFKCIAASYAVSLHGLQSEFFKNRSERQCPMGLGSPGPDAAKSCPMGLGSPGPNVKLSCPIGLGSPGPEVVFAAKAEADRHTKSAGRKRRVTFFTVISNAQEIALATSLAPDFPSVKLFYIANLKIYCKMQSLL